MPLASFTALVLTRRQDETTDQFSERALAGGRAGAGGLRLPGETPGAACTAGARPRPTSSRRSFRHSSTLLSLADYAFLFSQNTTLDIPAINTRIQKLQASCSRPVLGVAPGRPRAQRGWAPASQRAGGQCQLPTDAPRWRTAPGVPRPDDYQREAPLLRCPRPPLRRRHSRSAPPPPAQPCRPLAAAPAGGGWVGACNGASSPPPYAVHPPTPAALLLP